MIMEGEGEGNLVLSEIFSLETLWDSFRKPPVHGELPVPTLTLALSQP